VQILQGDLRSVDLGIEQFDVVTAGATLHHLRSDPEWESVFERVFRATKPGGSFWIIDLVEQSTPALQALLWRRWGEYLTGLQGEAYREKVFNYVDAEDTPHQLMFQLDLLRKVGFRHLEILHKTACFAAFGGIK
jgi:tRNA (cmo5U34)-methyltransferase